MTIRPATRYAPCFIYGLIDPRSGTVFYIGISFSPESRLYAHHHDRASAAYKRCEEIKAAGLEAQYVVFLKCDDRERARSIERRLIAEYPALTNTTKRLAKLANKKIEAAALKVRRAEWEKQRQEHAKLYQFMGA